MLVDDAAELAALVRRISHGLVVIANNSLSDESGEVIIGIPAHAFNSQGNIGDTHGVIANTNVRTYEVSLLLREQIGLVGRTAAGQTREMLLSQLNESLVRNTTGGSEDHAVSSVVVLDVVGQLGSRDVTDVLAGTKNGSSESLMLEGRSVQVVENNLLNLLLHLLGLPQNHITLAFDSRLLELGVLENIRENVDKLGNVGVERLGKVDRVLTLPQS
jgi:hypothetical protein